MIILSERHLHRLIREFLDYYYHHPTHRAPDRDCPVPRLIEEADRSKVVELSIVGGLHHRYTRRAACRVAIGELPGIITLGAEKARLVRRPYSSG